MILKDPLYITLNRGSWHPCCSRNNLEIGILNKLVEALGEALINSVNEGENLVLKDGLWHRPFMPKARLLMKGFSWIIHAVNDWHYFTFHIYQHFLILVLYFDCNIEHITMINNF